MRKIYFIVIGLIAVLFAIFVLPWLLVFVGSKLTPNPILPEVKYGRFPFVLEYSLNGNAVLIEDVLVVEFDGFGTNAAQGKYRRWDRWLDSNRDVHDILLTERENNHTVYFGLRRASLILMGEIHPPNNIDDFFTLFSVSREGDSARQFMLTRETLLERYGVEIIKWEISPPINNNLIDR